MTKDLKYASKILHFLHLIILFYLRVAVIKKALVFVLKQTLAGIEYSKAHGYEYGCYSGKKVDSKVKSMSLVEE